MPLPIVQQLEAYFTQDNFPAEEWEARGLYPSDEAIQQDMHQALVRLVQFLQNALRSHKPGSPQLQAAAQAYLEEWDIHDFDTEERDFLHDKAYRILRLVQVSRTDY